MKALRIISLILLIAWMIFIFSLSAQNAETSTQTSGGVISSIVRIFYPDFDKLSSEEQTEFIAPYQGFVRKTAHFTAYAILGVFSFFTYISYKKIPLKIRFSSSLITCLAYSISDEIHQLFIPGRSGEIRDICIDFCGSLLSITILTIISKSRKFKKYI